MVASAACHAPGHLSLNQTQLGLKVRNAIDGPTARLSEVTQGRGASHYKGRDEELRGAKAGQF